MAQATPKTQQQAYMNFLRHPRFTKISTGSANLIRQHMFNNIQDDIDVPDGDVEYGRQIFNASCLGCHQLTTVNLGPKIVNAYGMVAGDQPDFTKYSIGSRNFSFRWSKQKLFMMLEDSQQFFGLDSAMTLSPMEDPYQRSCVIEYMHFLRLTHPQVRKKKDHWIK